MPRRPRNPSSHIRKRKTKNGESWQAIVTFPDLDQPGVWHHRSRTFKRKGDAEAWKVKTLAEHRADPTHRPPSDVTMGDLVEQWLATLPSRNLAPKTILLYKQMSEHLIRAFGQRPAAALTTLDLQRLYAELTDAGKAPRTVRYVHATANRVFKDALDWRIVAVNPAARAKPPKLPRSEIEVPTPEEAGALLRAAQGHRLAPLWTWLSLTGTRKGEALALHWSDVDLNAGTATIRRSRGNLGLGPTKTQTSARSISLAPYLVEVLTKLREYQALEHAAAGDQWHENGLVFATSLGTPLNPRNVNRDLKTVLRRAGLSLEYHPHTFRHSMATFWLANGVPPQVVSERLGHSSVAFTLQIYGHVLPGQQAAAAAEMEADLVRHVNTASTGEVRDETKTGENSISGQDDGA